ncbi:hypothetical protein AGOR_G00006520 [Albula goreensis]|uniref:A-kinase anchor protein 13 n=1 Tax=Albula goreensis TaxID=1534307 RepID=A0A8T3E5Y4_9TELE|nr:hypothetical protein AGOR_G00006520 [Albula goreensis]
MKLNPQQAPLYGECLLTVQLCDEEIFEEEEDAICPAHDCCESVQITLCSAPPGQAAVPVGEGRFQFVQDLAYDMAQFLVSAAGRRDGLEAAMLLDQCEIPLQECEKLDQALAQALHHLALPQGWSVLGTSASPGTSEDPDPHETLLHFAARRGLRRVALFLLKQPGGREALRIPNKQGATPASVAERRGHTQLQQLLSEEDGGQDANNDMPWQIHSGERVVRHHPRLNTYTLTVGVTPGHPPPSLQEEVEELRRLIGCHVLSQLHCDPPLAAGDRIRITETETGGAHLAGAQQRSQTGGKKGTHPKTYTGHEAEGDPPRSAPLIHGNGRGRSVGACGNHSRDYEVQEEEGVGLPAAWLAGDGERAPERNRVVRSRVKDHSSALINTPLHETANPLPHTSDTLCQERESCEEKEEEREDRGERRLSGGKDWPAPCRSPQETDMGLAQSQEQSEMAAVETEWHGKGDEAIDKAMETVSRDEGGSCPEAKWDVETDDTNCAGQGLFSPGHPENTGEGEHSEAPGSAPPTTGTEELKSESNSLEQRKETAAGDEGTEKDREREGGLGQATDAEHELIRHSQASGSPVMETGNHSMHDNSSSESPCGAKDRPCFDQSHPLNTEECLCQSGPQVKKGLSENHDKKQEEGTNKKNDVALPSREPHPHELSNQEPIGELRHIQFDGEDPLGDAKEQSRASEPKQEDRKSMQDSEIKETKTESDLELGKGEKNFEDSKEKKSGSSDRTHIPPEREEVDLPAEDQVDSQRRPVPDPGKVDGAEIHKDDSFLCYNPFVDPPQQREQSPEPQESLCLTPPSAGSSVSASRPDSGSDGDGFFGTDVGEDGVFRKDPQVGDSTSEVSISCSSNEDAVSMGPPGSSADGGVVGRQSWNSEEVQQQEAEGRKEGDEEEEEKDHVTEVPARSSLLRCSERSPSPFRRHSWGPGKTSEGDISQCSLTGSLRKGTPTLQRRSYSLEGLTTDRYETKDGRQQLASPLDPCLARHPESEERGSLVSLTEEDLGSDQAERCSSLGSQTPEVFRPTRCIHGSMTLPLMKSVSLLAINQRDLDGMRSFSSVSGSLSHSISEEDPGPLRAGVEGKSVTKVGRTFSYLRNKMYKKTKEKEKEKNRVKEKEREAKEKEKRTLNGHIFSAVSSVPFGQCHQCHRVINSKEASYCTNCNAHVHKSCRETLPACTKIKMKLPKQQFAVPDSSTLKSKSLRERPWSILTAEDDGSRRHSGIKSFSSTNLSKSISISNIAGPVLDEIPLKGLRYLSQSTDSLHKTSKVNESTESLTDEGTDMMDSQLMGEFEVDARELEADSWSFTVDRKYLKQFKKDMIKRQDVIYELMQTEMHHVRTLRIVAEVYSKGLLKEVQLEAQTVERVFPALDDLLDIHSGFLSRILDRRKESRQEGGFLIRKIGDILVAQFSGSSAERMKKVYGKFCSRHKEALSFYKELHAKDKRFQAFIKKKMSSPVVRRLGIPECILLVTQRITKYPVLLQRMLQHTKEGDEDHVAVTQALGLVKEVIAAVDSKVNDQEKKQRLREVYRRTDSRSIMRMKSGQMFAREDLLRGRKLLHDGPLQLKTSAGRLKDVQALLLSDVFVFLQEKDQKYIFASLDQRATVLSLQKLIIREVANEEKGLFLITAGIEQPEMVEVHASSKEERNTWIQLIQEAVSSMEKEEDEGIPSESEEDKRVLEMKARELRDQLHEKDQEIAALLEEKLKVFRSFGDDSRLRSAASFRASAHDTLKGETVMKDALREVEVLQTLLNSGLGGVAGQQVGGALESTGGMGISKTGGRDSPDLLRKESDGTLKKGVNANLLQMLKRDSEQVLQSTCHLHELLNTLQAVVVQQDSILEEQRQALNDRSSSSPSSSSSSWRTSSLIEQEKQRSLEKQRQEAANLQRQQAAHTEERRRREREWEVREEQLREREAQLLLFEEEMRQGREEVMKEQQELRGRKEEYQRDLERLREAQRRLERDREHVDQELSTTEHAGLAGEKMSSRAPSTASEDSLRVHSPVEKKSSSPVRDTLRRIGSKRKGKTLNPFASNQSQKAPSGEGQSHISGRLLQLAKTKDPKEKKEKKKKGKGLPQPTDSTLVSVSE